MARPTCLISYNHIQRTAKSGYWSIDRFYPGHWRVAERQLTDTRAGKYNDSSDKSGLSITLHRAYRTSPRKVDYARSILEAKMVRPLPFLSFSVWKCDKSKSRDYEYSVEWLHRWSSSCWLTPWNGSSYCVRMRIKTGDNWKAKTSYNTFPQFRLTSSDIWPSAL